MAKYEVVSRPYGFAIYTPLGRMGGFRTKKEAEDYILRQFDDPDPVFYGDLFVFQASSEGETIES